MKKIYRNQAITILAYQDLLLLESGKRESILIDIFSENDEYESIMDFSSPEYNEVILEYLKTDYTGVNTSFLVARINELFHIGVEIIGIEEELFTCNCCGYKTLKLEGEYEICKVCFWEDDGTDEAGKFSSANGLTLTEARNNFQTLGASAAEYVKFVDQEGIHKYHKGEQ